MVEDALGSGLLSPQLWNQHGSSNLASDAGACYSADGHCLWAGAEPADLANQDKAGEARIGIIRPCLFDILAHPAKFGLADALPLDKGLDRLDLYQADDPALDAQNAVLVDSASSMYSRIGAFTAAMGSVAPGISASTVCASTSCGGTSPRSARLPISPSAVRTVSSGSIASALSRGSST